MNGNGFPATEYAPLADHLARNGFTAAVVRRPNGYGGDERFVVDAAETVLDTLDLTPEDPSVDLALIGHSAAGTLVVNAAVTAARDGRLPVRAVVGLAPSSLNSRHLDGRAADSYLLMYGSQDEDITGFSKKRREAFRAYDHAGSEYSSTCNRPGECFFSPPRPFEKTMIYIHGADHAGLIGSNRTPGPLPENTEYVAAADQLCIVKAYVTGFLRRELLNEVQYRGLMRGTWEPASVAGITTAEPDALDTPSGSPLQLEFQISPALRRVVQNFQTGPGDYTRSKNVVVRNVDATELSTADHYVRHDTRLALVGWSDRGSVRWSVPERSRIGRTYTHFAFRVGQLHAAPEPYDNTDGADQFFELGLEDGSGGISWHEISDVAAPDPRVHAPAKAVSSMQTVRIPVAEIEDVDLEDIRYFRLKFKENTRGTLMFDNFEWHRDSPFVVNPRLRYPLHLPSELTLPPGSNRREKPKIDAETRRAPSNERGGHSSKADANLSD